MQLNVLYQQLVYCLKQWKGKYVILSPLINRFVFTITKNASQNSQDIKITIAIPHNRGIGIEKFFIPSSYYLLIEQNQGISVKLSGSPCIGYRIVRKKIKRIYSSSMQLFDSATKPK